MIKNTKKNGKKITNGLRNNKFNEKTKNFRKKTNLFVDKYFYMQQNKKKIK